MLLSGRLHSANSSISNPSTRAPHFQSMRTSSVAGDSRWLAGSYLWCLVSHISIWLEQKDWWLVPWWWVSLLWQLEVSLWCRRCLSRRSWFSWLSTHDLHSFWHDLPRSLGSLILRSVSKKQTDSPVSHLLSSGAHGHLYGTSRRWASCICLRIFHWCTQTIMGSISCTRDIALWNLSLPFLTTSVICVILATFQLIFETFSLDFFIN